MEKVDNTSDLDRFFENNQGQAAITRSMNLAESSFRTVRIVSAVEKGVSFDDDRYPNPDSNPDRTLYKLEPVNCTIDEFMEWFFVTEKARGFCTDGGVLIDIGGSTLSFAVGETLSVGFSEWFELWLSHRVVYEKREIKSMFAKFIASYKNET